MADPIQLVLKLIDSASPVLERVSKQISSLQGQSGGLGKVLGDALNSISNGFSGLGGQSGAVFSKLSGGLGAVASGATAAFGAVSAISFGFNQVTQAVQTLASAAKPAYDFLIGSNEKLNAQLLTSQTNLASATRIFKNGVEITDPTEKIKSTQPQLRAALKQIEKDTEDLVGVTSSQVNELFQITLQNAAQLNNQSKQFPGPIQAATTLTKGWAAGLKVIGLPIAQANQEINSILRAQLDQNSVLGKNLGLTNEQVNKWKAQGILVDELNKRLQTFVAGNAIAAQSIEGITSNIADAVELFGREVGQPLLAPIIAGLDSLFKYIKQNRESVIAFFRDASTQAVQSFQEIGQSLAPVFGVIAGLVRAAAPGVNAIFQTILKLGEVLVGILSPALAAIGAILTPVVQGFSIAFQVINVVVDAITRLFRLAQPLNAAYSGFFLLLQEAFNRFGGSLSDAISTTQRFIDAVIAGLEPLVQFIGATLNGTLKPAVDFLGKAFALAGKGAENFGKLAIQSLQALASTISDSPIGKIIGALLTQLDKLTGNSVSKGVEKFKEAFNGTKDGAKEATDEYKIQAKELERLGSTYEQLQKKVANAQRNIAEEGGGDPERFKAATKELIELTQQQVELGQISATEAAARLQELANNAKVDIDNQRKARQEALKLELTEAEQLYKDAEANIQEVQANGQISEAKANQDSLEAKKQAADAKLEISRQALNNDPSNRELKSKVEQAETEAAQAAKKIRDEAFKQVLLSFDREQSVLNGKRAQGLVNEEQYNAESLEITRNKLDAEQEEVNRQRATMTDQKGLQELAAKEGEIQKKRVEALKKFEDARLAVVEKSIKKALDAVKLAETEREIETQKLLNLNIIRGEEANQRGLEGKAKTIQKELELEQEKADEIARLPRLSDPALEEERQTKIRASQQRTAELTSQLLKNQADIDAARTKVVQDKIDRELRRLTNTYTKQEQSLGRLGQAQDLVAKSIERQNDLLNAQKDLQQAISSYVEGEYRIAEELTVSEGKKRRIREEAARKRLEFLQKEQILEGLSLELELAKNKALIERERIQNKIDQSKAKSEVAGAQADLAKTLVDKKALPEEVEAKKLALQAAQDKLTGVNEQGQLIEQQARQEGLLDKFKRRKLELQQSLQTDQAEAALAKETRTKSDDRAVSARSLERARLFQDGLPDLTSSIRAELEKEKQRSNVNRLETVQDSTPGRGGNVAVNDPSKAFNAAIDRLVTQKKSEDVKIEQQNTFTFNLAGGNAMNESQAELKSQVLGTLYDALRTAKNKGK